MNAFDRFSRDRFQILALVLAIVAAVALGLGASSSSAATVIWTGGGGNGNWSNGANWSAGSPPAPGDDVVLTGQGVAPTNDDLPASTILHSVTLNSRANGYSISGQLSLQSGGFITDNNGIGPDTVNVAGNGAVALNGPAAITLTSGAAGFAIGSITGTGPLTLTNSNASGSGLELAGPDSYSGVTTIDGSGGAVGLGGGAIPVGSALTVNAGGTALFQAPGNPIGSLAGAGNVALGSGTLTTGGDDTSTTFAGVLSGTGGLDKTGSGTLTLSGPNTYSGGTTVDGGTLTITNGGALGSGNMTVDGGATLDLNGVTVGNPGAAQSLTLNGDGFQAIGALINSGSGSASWSGPVILGSTSTIGGSGPLTLSGGISGNSSLIGLIKVGTGTLMLSGNNSYGGTTDVQQGTLTISGTLAGNVTVVSGATFALGANSTIGSLAGDGTVALSSAFGGGILTAGGDNTSTTFTGVISGQGALTKTGTGTLTLSGNNTYSGGTTVAGGILTVGNGNALGSGLATVDGGATLDVNGVTVGNQLALNGPGFNDGGALINNGTAGSAWGGGIDLGSNSTIGGSAPLTLSGNISGNFGLTKAGTGTLTLSGSNTYSGGTTVDDGIISVANGSALGSGSTTVASGGTLDLNGVAVGLSGNETLTLNGDGFNNGGALFNSGGVPSTWGGPIFLGSNSTIGGSGPLTLSGGISGNSSLIGLIKVGTGTLVLSGNNTYSGQTSVNSGTLNVTGTVSASTVVVAAGATLGGTGTIATLVASGTVAPGLSGTPGALTVVNGASFNGGSSFTPALDSNTSFSQLFAGGTLTLDSNVTLAPALNFAPTPGQQFTVIQANAVSGTFAGGTTVTAIFDGIYYYFNHTDGSGHVLLTVLGQQIMTAGVSIPAVEGASFSGTVATFTDPDPGTTAGDYSATINWGDGSPSTSGTIATSSNGGFNVGGTHTYAEEGAYSLTVPISDVDGTNATATSTANVADAALTSSGTTITATQGHAFSGAVASFTDSNSTSTASDFSVTINWGDSTSSTGSVAASLGGGFTVSGSHTYAETGSFTIMVAIADDGGSQTTPTTTAKVYAATVTGVNPSIGGARGGTSVTITGTNFSGVTAVKFGATVVSSFTVNSDTQITATSTAGTANTVVDVTVTAPGGTSATSAADRFTYLKVGDVNGDGSVTSVDALCVLRIVASLPSTSACPIPPPGDPIIALNETSADGPTSVDALCILRGVVGLLGTATCPDLNASIATPTTASGTTNRAPSDNRSEAVGSVSLVASVQAGGSARTRRVEVRANISSASLGAWSIDVSYDPATTKVTSCEAPEGSVCNTGYQSGTVRISGANASGLRGEQTLATLTVEGTGALKLTARTATDTEGQPLAATIAGSKGSGRSEPVERP